MFCKCTPPSPESRRSELDSVGCCNTLQRKEIKHNDDAMGVCVHSNMLLSILHGMFSARPEKSMCSTESLRQMGAGVVSLVGLVGSSLWRFPGWPRCGGEDVEPGRPLLRVRLSTSGARGHLHRHEGGPM